MVLTNESARYSERIIAFIVRSALKIAERVRYRSYANRMQQFGTSVEFDKDVTVIKPERICIGNRVFVGRWTIINAGRGSKIEIGDDCAIAAGCKLITWNHNHHNQDLQINRTGELSKPITLGTGCWLGYDVIILPGVHLDDGCVVAAGSVVTQSFGKYSVIAGIPARKIYEREEN